VALGGMAEILLALEISAKVRRFVTIKRIRTEHACDPDYIDFFQAEGRISMRCNHNNLTRSFKLGTVGHHPYLAMEFIRGHTLLDLIRASYHRDHPIAISSAIEIGARVTAALDHLHGMCDAHGRPMHVVHRDVTPQNIMVDAAGGIKLIDFGIARSAVQLHKTQEGTLKGKFSYMAPEQLHPERELDHRGDLFSLGIVLHETLTARSLFRGAHDAETLDRVREMEIPPMNLYRDDVPPELEQIVHKALERDPDRRFQSAGDMLSALLAVARKYCPSGGKAVLRDELLDLCGDPPIASLPPDVVAFVQKSMTAPPILAAAADAELQYFLSVASPNIDAIAESASKA
jgi:serine/threonine protein kinase